MITTIKQMYYNSFEGEENMHDCPVCHGNGELECHECGGTGHLHGETCPACEGHGTVVCVRCDGAGALEEAV